MYSCWCKGGWWIVKCRTFDLDVQVSDSYWQNCEYIDNIDWLASYTYGIMDIILLTSSLKKWKEQQCVEERKKGFLIWKTVKKFSIIHPFSYILNDTMTKNPYIFLCRKLSVLVYLFQRQDFEDCHASLQFISKVLEQLLPFDV